MSRLLVATALLSVFFRAGSAGACVDDADCDDHSDCTTDSCTPTSVCANDPLLNGTPCPFPGGDGNLCNGLETCQGGACYPGYPLNVSDGNPCTIDGCHPLTGATHDFAPDGTPCPDADVCDGEETCQMGWCIPGLMVCSPECAGQNPGACLQVIPLMSAPASLALAGLLALAAMGRSLRRSTAAVALTVTGQR